MEEESDGGSAIAGAIGGIGDDATVQLLGVVVTANGAPNSLTVGGETVLFDISEDGQTLTGFLPPDSDGGEPRTVFTLQLADNPLGAFSFLLERPLDHVDPNASGAADTIELALQVLVSGPGVDPGTVGDGTGSPVNAVTQILVVVNDSAPSAVDDGTVVTEETGELTSEEAAAATIFGNVLPNDGQSADSPAPGGPLVSFAFSGGVAAAGSTVTTDNGGLLTVNADGSWSYLPPVNVADDVDDGFTYTLQDFDGDSSSARQPLIVTDDSSNDLSSPTIVSADLESKLPGGSDEDPDGVVAIIGELVIDFGKDQDSVQISDIELDVVDQNGNSIALADLTSGGSPIVFEETTGSRTLTAFFAEGPRTGEKIFELTVDEDGNSAVISEEGDLTAIEGPFFRFELFASIDHSVAGAVGPDDTLTLVFNYTASDGSDSATGAVTISLLDDGPAVIANEDRSVQESALPDGSGADPGGTTLASGVLGFLGGADTAEITAVAVDGLAGVLDAATGEFVVDGGFYQLRVDAETGAYVYDLTGPATHPNGAQPANSLVQTVTYSVTDGDRDPVVGTLLIGVDDDGSSASDDSDTADEGGPGIMGNVLTGEEFEGGEAIVDSSEADILGADGAARIAEITDQSNGTTYNSGSGGFDASTGVLTITTAIGGSLAIVIEQVPGGDPLGKYTYSPPASGPEDDNGLEVFDYLLEDTDGSSSAATLSITIVPADPILVVGENVDDVAGQTTDHRVANPDGAPNGAIVGGNGEDALIGDVGGSVATTKSANIVLSLDTSGSAGEFVVFDGEVVRRIRAMDKSVEALVDDLIASGASDVALHLIDFDTTFKEAQTFHIVAGGLVDAAAVVEAKAFVLATEIGDLNAGREETAVARGSTNFEAGFQAAINFYGSGDRIVDADINQTIHISDGGPTRFLIGNSTDFDDYVESGVSSAEAIRHVLGTASGADDVNEVQALLDLGSTVDAIGLVIEEGGSAESNLDRVDGGGDADIVTMSDDWHDVLLDLSTVFDLADVGGDSLLGSPDDDLILGDSVFSDLVARDADILAVLSQGANDALAALPEGSGWTVFEVLIDDGFFANSPAVTQFLRDPINIAKYGFGRESDLNGATRAGGDDMIDGGSGNDIIFGQEGDDTILDGSGADIVIGGSGADIISLSADGESDRLLYGSLNEAGDSVSGFNAGAPGAGGDIVDIADLLDGTGVATLQDALDGGFLNLTDVGGDAAIGVDANGTGSFTPLVTLEGIGIGDLDDNIVVA